MRWRARLRERPVADVAYRIAVALLGVVVLAVGVVAIPYPGPGWAIFFVGLGVLASEFRWAKRLLFFGKGRYEAVMAWFRRQGIWVQGVSAVLSAAAVLATMWLVGAVGWSADLAGLEGPWLDSPIGLGT